MPITVALDPGPEPVRQWIDAAKPTHPSLIDPRHVVADLYNAVNVPTVLWIDARGRIARPNDVAFGTDTFRHITGLDSAKSLAAPDFTLPDLAARLHSLSRFKRKKVLLVAWASW